jgi:hypothetical protein
MAERGLKRQLPQLQGAKSPHAKFTEKDIITAIEMKLAGETSLDVEEETGINLHYVSLIMAGRTWRCIQHPLERLERWRDYILEPYKGGLRYAQPEHTRIKRLREWERNLGEQYKAAKAKAAKSQSQSAKSKPQPKPKP